MALSGAAWAEEIRLCRSEGKECQPKGPVRLVLSTRTAMGEPKPTLTVALLPASSFSFFLFLSVSF